MINIINIYKGIKSISLEQRLAQIFATSTTSFFLNELLYLGFEYFFKFPETLNLELTKGTFYLKNLLNNTYKINKTFLFRNNNYYLEYILNFKSFIKFNFLTNNLFYILNPISNPLNLMVTTGTRSNPNQASQVSGMRGYITTVRDFTISLPILQNFTKGLNILEYIISAYGTRKGILDTAIKTSDTGYFTRRIIESLQDVIIKEKYCGTKNTVNFIPSHNITGNIITIENNLLIYKYIIKSKFYTYPFQKHLNYYSNFKLLKNFKSLNCTFELYLKTPIICNSGRSVCYNCLGLNYQIKTIPNISIGVLIGESLGEPFTQLTLRTFHTGGTLKQTFKENNIYHNYVIFNLKKNLIKYNYKLLGTSMFLNKTTIKTKFYNKRFIILKKVVNSNINIKLKLNTIFPIYMKTQQVLFSYKYYKNLTVNSINIKYPLIYNNSIQMLIKNFSNTWLLYNIIETIGYNYNVLKYILFISGIIIQKKNFNIYNVKNYKSTTIL